MEAEIHEIAENYPEIVKIDTLAWLPTLYDYIYDDVDSMAIYAVKISDNVEIDEDEPVFHLNGLHHAEEIISPEIILYMLNDLAENYGVDEEKTSWVDDNEIWLVPMINPRGHFIVVDSIDAAYRKNTRDNNENGIFDYDPGIVDEDGAPDYDGVDINRNYDFNWGEPDTNYLSETYAGTAPFSEPETQAIRDLFLATRPTFAINYHSSRTGNFAEAVIYPWKKGGILSPDYPSIYEVADNVCERIIRDYSPGTYTLRPGAYGKYNEDGGYWYDGGFARNWQYATVGTISLLVEAGADIVPPWPYVDDICERNLVGAYWLFERIKYGSITGHVTDAETGNPLEASLTIIDSGENNYPDMLIVTTSDPTYGRYRRILEVNNPTAGPYTLQFSVENYETVIFEDVDVSPDSVVVIDVAMTDTIIEDESYDPSVPSKISLDQNYPNPFNPVTTIQYAIPEKSNVKLAVYNTAGQEVETLINKKQEQGSYSIKWNAENYASGVYFYTLDVNGSKLTKKLVLLK